MNKEELAKKVTALVAMTYKHAYEKGQANPSEETIKKIAIMANQGECQAAPLEKIVEYVKQHWNDE